MNRLTRLGTTLLLGVALFTPGCSYIKHRVMDMSDVIDIKYGYAVGAGVKVEATNWIGVGVGWGISAKTREWYGRRSHVAYDQEFMHFILAGRDGTKRSWGEPGLDGTDFYNMVLPINIAQLDHSTPPILQRFRFGAEVIFPTTNAGLYLNLGELCDFILGLTTIDIAGDDGVPKSEQYDDHFKEEVDPEDGEDE
jgi:hypothetical protein